MRAGFLILILISGLFISLTGNVSEASFSVAANRLSDKTNLRLSRKIFASSNLPFFERDSALAMNIPYLPIFKLRKEIESATDQKLDFLKTWNSGGEAHITVITPPEYTQILSQHLSLNEINEIARRMNIQSAQFTVMGLGSGQKQIGARAEKTYFLIVKSDDLLRIRRAIAKEYIRRGGAREEFDANHFYPHITIGYTLRDLHEADGVIKDLANSEDSKFKLKK